MGRQPRRCAKKCLKHHFSLKPVHYSAALSRQTVFSYCPQNSKSQPNFPKFNTDKKPYTSSFLLPCDKAKLISNDLHYQIDHQRFKKQNASEKSELMMPKPRNKYSYCSVCKSNFQDYQTHIESDTHRDNIQLNKFEPLINQLCERFSAPVEVEVPEEIDHMLTSKISLETSEDSSQIVKAKEAQFSFNEPAFLFEDMPKNIFPAIGLQGSFKSIPMTSNAQWEPYENAFCQKKSDNRSEIEAKKIDQLDCKTSSPMASPRKIAIKPIILNGTLKL